jgi:hemerythrin-like metal-binding protein
VHHVTHIHAYQNKVEIESGDRRMSQSLYIIWNDSNNLGIPIVDEQHRGIVSIINSFHHFIQEGHGMDSMVPTIGALEHLIRMHFKTEEALFRKIDFPEYTEHIQAHKKFLQQAQAASTESMTTGDARILLDFLKLWWMTHINREDRKYLPYLK